MKRDFSQTQIDELWRIADQNRSEIYGMAIQKFQEEELFEAAVGLWGAEKFLDALREKEAMTVDKMGQIVTGLKEADQTYGGYLKTLNEQMDAYGKKLRSLGELLQPEKLSMNNEQYREALKAVGSRYRQTMENSEIMKLELWLRPGYQLEGKELKEAEKLVEKYFAPGTDEARVYYEDMYNPVDESIYKDWTENHWKKFQLMKALDQKLGTLNSFGNGVAEAVPFWGSLSDWSAKKSAKLRGYEFEELCKSDNVFANSHTQHPYVTFGGNLTGSLLTYELAAKTAGSIPGLSRRISSISQRISAYPILNRIGQDHISNIIGATVIDTGVLTLPNAIRDIQNGETAGNVFRNAGLDMGKNLLFNIGGEAVSGAIGAVVKRGEGEINSINDLKVVDGKVDGKVPLSIYEKYRIESVHNPESTIMTLGKYEPTIRVDGTKDFSMPGPEAYIVKAEDTSYFSLGTEWDSIVETYGLDKAGKNMFDYFNKPALDDAVKNNKIIRFSHNPEAYGECALKWEWDYLQEKYGYFSLEKEGDFWYAAR